MRKAIALVILLVIAAFAMADPPEFCSIYLYKKDMPDNPKNPLKLKKVTRQINGESDNKPQAMNEILYGPLSTEHGFGSLETDGITYWKIKQSGENFGIYFKEDSSHHWHGARAEERFREAVKKTMHEFPLVKTVKVYLNNHEI